MKYSPIRYSVIPGCVLAVFVACQSSGGAGGPSAAPGLARRCGLTGGGGSDRDPLYAQLNRLRQSSGRSPLFYDRDLARAAGVYARELVASGRISHDEGPTERLRRDGLVRRYVAENLARFAHRADPRDYVVQHWTHARQEHTNLMSSRYVRMGAALAASDSYCYAVLLLTE